MSICLQNGNQLQVICLFTGVNVDDSDQDVRIPVVNAAEHLAGIWTNEL